jgi:hypothetical protein
MKSRLKSRIFSSLGNTDSEITGACTAVVTEMSWNSSEDENAKYRANIEFIQAADWEKDLRILLTELIDNNGQVCLW